MGQETDKAGQPLAHSASQNWTLGMLIKDGDKPASLVLHLQVHAATEWLGATTGFACACQTRSR